MAKKARTKKSANQSLRTAGKPSAKKRNNSSLALNCGDEFHEDPSPTRTKMSKTSSSEQANKSDQTRRLNVTPVNSNSVSPASAPKIRTSQRERTNVNYDMHYHPADKILRPNYPATKLALSHELGHHEADTSDEDVSDGSEIDRVEGNEGDDEGTASSRVTKQESLQSTRSGRNVKPVNYDMKHHPMDAILRPKATASRAAPALDSNPSSIPRKGPSATSSKPATSEPDDDDENPFTKSIARSIADLGKFDHRLYFLAQDPLVSWPDIERTLVRERWATKRQMDKSGGLAALQSRSQNISRELAGVYTMSEDDGDAETGILNKQSLDEDHKKEDQNGTTQAHDPILTIEEINAETTNHDTKSKGETHLEPTTTGLDLEAGSDLAGAFFAEASTNSRPFADLMTEEEVSNLLNEQVEAISNHYMDDHSVSGPGKRQQIVQVVIPSQHSREKTPSNLLNEHTECFKSKKKRKRASSARVEFAVHEDQPGTPSTPTANKRAVLRPMSPNLDIPKENLESEDQSMATEGFGSTEVDLRDLLQPIEAYNRRQRAMGEIQTSSPVAPSLRVNASSGNGSSPYMSVYGFPDSAASDAFTSRFAAVPAVGVPTRVDGETPPTPAQYPADPTRTFPVPRPSRLSASEVND